MSDLKTCICTVKVKLCGAGSENKSVVILISPSFLDCVSFSNSSSINQMIVQINECIGSFFLNKNS